MFFINFFDIFLQLDFTKFLFMAFTFLGVNLCVQKLLWR